MSTMVCFNSGADHAGAGKTSVLPLAILLSDPEWLPPASCILVGATFNCQAQLPDCLQQPSRAPARGKQKDCCCLLLSALRGRAKRQMRCIPAAMRLCDSMCWSLRAWQCLSGPCATGVPGLIRCRTLQRLAVLRQPILSATGAGASALGSQGSSATHGCPAGGGSGAEGGLQGQAGGLRGARHQDRGCDRGHPPAQAAAGEDLLLWACATAVPPSSS